MFLLIVIITFHQQLERAEDLHRQLLEKVEADAEKISNNQQMIRNVNSFVENALGDIGVKNTTYYVNEMMRFMNGMLNHIHHGAPLPKHPISEGSPSVSGRSHTHTQLEPGMHSSNRRPSAPPTPKNWQSTRPTYGRPEATQVPMQRQPPENYNLDLSHDLAHYFGGSFDHGDV